MARFIPLECFQKKGNTFRAIPFFSLWPEFSENSVPFVHNYKCRSANGLFHLFFNPNNRFTSKWHSTFPFPFFKVQNMQYHLLRHSHRKFHSNGRRSLCFATSDLFADVLRVTLTYICLARKLLSSFKDRIQTDLCLDGLYSPYSSSNSHRPRPTQVCISLTGCIRTVFQSGSKHWWSVYWRKRRV